MKKSLAVFATAMIFGALANAADDKGTEFKFGGEVLQRFTTNQNDNVVYPVGGPSTAESNFLSRNQFHVNAIASDKLQAYFNVINYFVWGQSGSVPTNAYPYGSVVGQSNANGNITNGTYSNLGNDLQIQEAWLWWKVSDMFSLRAGRQSLDYGDGLAFSKNDWLATPYNTDAIMGRLSWDFLDLDVGGGKFLDSGMQTPAIPGVVAATASTTDTEVDFYGAYASVKNLPDVLKKAEIFVVQVNEDANLPVASTFIPSYTGTLLTGAANEGALGLTSIGIHLKGDFSLIDYRLDGTYQTGKQKAVTNAAQGLTAQDVTFAANMEDIEVGANFPEFMHGRIYAGFHRDTGDDSSDRTQQHKYQPLFYDRHQFAGLNDLVGFGNLTNIRIGVSGSPTEDDLVGAEVNLLSRTSTSTYASATLLSAAEGSQWASLTQGAGIGSSDAGLGTEFGIYGKHNYGHGFSMLAQVTYFSLGSYLKSLGGASSNPIQGVVQAKYAF